VHFDTKFLRTLKFLLFRPGKLTKEFTLNRRAAYVPPFRLYVFISFFFFLLLSFDRKGQAPAQAEDPAESSSPEIARKAAEQDEKVSSTQSKSGLAKQDVDWNEGDFHMITQAKTDQAVDSIMVSKGQQPTPTSRYFLKQVSKFMSVSPKERNAKVIKSISLLMFVLMPFFGALVQGVHFRLRRHYIEYLMFSVHFHCFVFVFFGLYYLVGFFTDSKWIDLVAFLLPPAYLFLALRTLFHQSSRKALFKTALLSLLYAFSLLLLIVIAFLISMLLI
jgi:hypothetical protein